MLNQSKEYLILLLEYKRGGIFLLINQLLNSETQLELSLLQTLFVHRVWLATQELQDYCQKSRNTIIKYCEILKEEAENIKKEDLIQHERGKGYRFNGTKEDYQTLFISLIQRSPSFDLLRQLLLKEKVSLIQFAEQHYIDTMTVRLMLKKFNRYAKKIDLSFQIANGNLRVVGPELTVRYFSYTFFWFVYKGTVWPFPGISESQLRSFAERTFAKYAHVNDVIIHQWAYILAVNMTRISNGYSITKEMLPDFSEDFIEAIYLSKNHQESERFFNDAKQFSSFSHEEVIYFLLLMHTGVRVYTVDGICSRALEFHKDNKTILYEKGKVIHAYFPEFEQATAENKMLANSVIMAALLNLILFPKFTVSISGYGYHKYMEENLPYLKQEILKRIKKMQKNDDFFVTSQEYLLLRLSEMYTLIGNPVDFNPKITVRLETDLPLTLEKLMKTRLLSLFGSFYHLSIITSLDKENRIEPDLIVSSTKPMSQVKQNIPIIYVNPKFMNSDLKDLTEAFKKLIVQQRSE